MARVRRRSNWRAAERIGVAQPLASCGKGSHIKVIVGSSRSCRRLKRFCPNLGMFEPVVLPLSVRGFRLFTSGNISKCSIVEPFWLPACAICWSSVTATPGTIPGETSAPISSYTSDLPQARTAGTKCLRNKRYSPDTHTGTVQNRLRREPRRRQGIALGQSLTPMAQPESSL